MSSGDRTNPPLADPSGPRRVQPIIILLLKRLVRRSAGLARIVFSALFGACVLLAGIQRGERRSAGRGGPRRANGTVQLLRAWHVISAGGFTWSC